MEISSDIHQFTREQLESLYEVSKRTVIGLRSSVMTLEELTAALRLQVKHQRAAFDALIGVGKLTDDEVEAALAFAESLEFNND